MQPQQPWQLQQPPQQVMVNIQAERNYTPAAWLSAGLSVIAFIPGLVAATIYLVEATGVKRRTGVSPQGLGCLWAVFIWCMIPVALICMWLVSTFIISFLNAYH